MDSLEANFPHLFPKPPTPAVSRLPGDRGLARDEVKRSENQVQCDQDFLDGVLRGQMEVNSTILKNLDAFGLGDPEAFDRDPEPIFDEIFDKMDELKLETLRLKAHPELFSNSRARDIWVQQINQLAATTSSILDGKFDMLEVKRHMEERADAGMSKAPAASVAQPPPPWMTWCRQTTMAVETLPQTMKDFQAKNPDMVLVGTQLMPHMGVLIAEHWRHQSGTIIEDIGTKHGYPEILDQYPKLQEMVQGCKFSGGGKHAVLKFRVRQPAPAQHGHMFAFGPQEKIANMARLMAMFPHNRDVTNVGFPFAVMMGMFVDKKEAKRLLPHFTPIE